jgi:hypothetical protein
MPCTGADEYRATGIRVNSKQSPAPTAPSWLLLEEWGAVHCGDVVTSADLTLPALKFLFEQQCV